MNEIQAIRENERRRHMDELRKIIPEINRRQRAINEMRRKHPELFPLMKGSR